MKRNAGPIPAPKRAPDWRDQAACRTENPDLWFPAGDSGPYFKAIEQAKQICARCPVAVACLQYAATAGIDSGIFGGLTEQERRTIRKSARRQGIPLDEAATRKKEKVTRPTTMVGIFDANTAPLNGGHAEWVGTRKVSFKGQTFTPKQFAFTFDRGRAPDGRITSECGITNCILPAHLKDQQERGVCGTRSGYQLHRREKTEICAPCRKANADADNRLRRTGTTKARVAA